MSEKNITDLKGGLHIAFDVEVAVQIRFGQTNFRPGLKHPRERFGMVQRDNGGARSLIWPRCAVPKPDADLFERRAGENFAENVKCSLFNAVLRRTCAHRAVLKSSDHSKLHSTRFADHVLVPRRIPNELDVGFVHTLD